MCCDSPVDEGCSYWLGLCDDLVPELYGQVTRRQKIDVGSKDALKVVEKAAEIEQGRSGSLSQRMVLGLPCHSAG